MGIGGKSTSYLEIVDGTSLDAVLKALRNFKRGGGERNIGHGLDFIRQQISTNGVRPRSKQNIVVLTTGGDEVNDDATLSKHADALRGMGLNVITVAIGDQLGNVEKISRKQNIIYVKGGVRVLPGHLGDLESQIGMGLGENIVMVCDYMKIS